MEEGECVICGDVCLVSYDGLRVQSNQLYGIKCPREKCEHVFCCICLLELYKFECPVCRYSWKNEFYFPQKLIENRRITYRQFLDKELQVNNLKSLLLIYQIYTLLNVGEYDMEKSV